MADYKYLSGASRKNHERHKIIVKRKSINLAKDLNGYCCLRQTSPQIVTLPDTV